jgi:hypothetical protein
MQVWTHLCNGRVFILVVLRNAPDVILCSKWLTGPRGSEGTDPSQRPSALWFCPPVRPWMPDRFWRNVLGISLDGEPSPSKGKERTVALGQLLPLQGQEPLRPDRALRCE